MCIRDRHILSGNLSHQIEHHLFPDLPSNRYAEIAPKVRDLFERNGLDYCARPLPQQVYSAWHKVVRLSLPNGWLDQTNARNLPCLLYTSDAADERSSVDLGGRRI